MNFRKMILWVFCLFQMHFSFAQEKVFANYFDIAVNSPENTEVTGRIHLERNKDVLSKPIPKSYQFAIADQKGDLFAMSTKFDPAGRIMGIITTKQKLDEKMLGNQQLTVVLKDGAQQLNSFPVTVKVVKQTLWETLFNRYKDETLTAANGRMFGRKKPKDAEVEKTIVNLEATKGEFIQYGFYHKNPNEYKPVGKSIEYDWESVSNQIGGLGYAYATSKKYGPAGNSAERERLKRTIYSAIIAYTEAVPVEGKDVIIAGKPIGNCTGDGFANLRLHNLIEEQVVTHQWVISDALIAPVVHLMPEMIAEMKNGDKQAERVYYDLVRFYQTAMAEVANRRAVNDPAERWGKITDTLRSSGAWADANLGHRSRMMLALPIMWADYNRPMTYVQYWYSDYYKGQPFKGMSFSPGWSPNGVVADVARWMTKYKVPAHQYIQSGFQPDGTVSHHIANATDVAMVAYGFEWLTDAFVGFNQFKNTDFKLPSSAYQFPADRLERIYPKIIYKNRFDFLISGRSYGDDLQKFVNETYLKAISDLKNVQSEDTKIMNQAELDDAYHKIKSNKQEYSGTDAYWVNEFLVHRRVEGEKTFYVSLKLKSKRTVGAEDFGRVRRSWYAGYGILPLKIKGDEYSEKVLANMDWHALPGLTEEWRTDAMPVGHAQASLPGDNDVAGVTADGKTGIAIYHHLPREKYSSATAFKSYYFAGDKIIALGNNIKRVHPGQQKDIITTVDQSSFINPLTVFRDGIKEVIQPGDAVDLKYDINGPMWLHSGDKGYIIFPEGKEQLNIKTGKEINITDPTIADKTPNFIISINHGLNPDATKGYFYCLVPNVTADEMNAVLEKYARDIIYKKDNGAHGVYLQSEKIWELAFFKPATLTLGNLTVTAEAPALMILKDSGDKWKLTVSNPSPAIDRQQLIFHVSQPLKAGRYNYNVGGIYPRKGEYVTVLAEGTGAKIVAELADKRDEAFYNYQAELYNGAPVTIEIAK
ncbi:silent information regulator protein Sir2 [Pedobacter sp. HMWF019]|uniref:polysaccharide lyase family 8 super-sandwich domain-containing protein n=1 Tax=Pedobacter sp. HMWF019 TaxID=2056856 RepID=UPI000D38187A|nr:polysaccharide lyase family 8 super-sandwich domain-containing protein [Pedobacter sp. HMWF019]PTS92407.1 silent information regulator protein Sir2 [Pedobacter sp. HMWF019]